ncbi:MULTISPECIES: hypothetical protein [Acinetobacter]|uniref:hypothetical protein n=1 Tax=Acinetobacter TaxID=469 RepID=UPI001443D083|nr:MULTISPECIES: hypothetical protein [Acinetobacter]MDM1261952.1 hypothetical protein [Acinetobacter indicus]MDM1274969.1 hypothetical protein [Acinetobacter indicus]MDM1301231.1 hypothetical protein [Acinetobacter indicus]
MDTQTDILNIFVSRLISSPAHDEAIRSLIKIFDQVIIKTRCLPNFDIPYDDITELIYDYSQDISLEELDLMMEELEGRYQELYPLLDDGNKHPKHKCLTKFRRHIYLAATQKNYINKVTQQEAKIARNTAISAQEISRRAEKISTEAELLAKKSEKLANEADAQAKSTIANYISILGIFASIIFTLFGGVNLIGSTVKLLEVNSRWPYLTFIISLLMICLLTLLNTLVKWINSMSNLKRALENQNRNDGFTIGKISVWKPWTWDFYSKSVSSFLIILLISLAGMYNVNKEHLFTVTNETTTKMVAATPPSVEPNKKPSETVETTEVKKLTVTNKIKEDAREENKEEKTEN